MLRSSAPFACSPSPKPTIPTLKRELTRINKLHLQARARLAELEGRRAVSAQFEPTAERVKLCRVLMRDRLNDLSFEEKRDVLDALQAQFTLDKEGELWIVLVLPSVSETGESYTTLRRASAWMFQDQGIDLLAAILQAT